MYTNLEHYIDGNWVEATSGKTFDVMNPATNVAMAKLSLANKHDLDKALAGKTAFVRPEIGEMYEGLSGGASRRDLEAMRKRDGALVLGVVAAGIAVGWINAFWTNGVFAIIAVLLLCTLANRVRQGLKEVQQDGSSA